MGEEREDRVDLAMQLREINANVVPINILNPIEGTPLENQEPLPPMEILKTIAVFPIHPASQGDNDRRRPHGEPARHAEHGVHRRRECAAGRQLSHHA